MNCSEACGENCRLAIPSFRRHRHSYPNCIRRKPSADSQFQSSHREPMRGYGRHAGEIQGHADHNTGRYIRLGEKRRIEAMLQRFVGRADLVQHFFGPVALSSILSSLPNLAIRSNLNHDSGQSRPMPFQANSLFRERLQGRQSVVPANPSSQRDQITRIQRQKYAIGLACNPQIV